MAARHQPVHDEEDLSIEGEVFSEQDLANESDLLSLALPGNVDQGWLLGELWKDLERGEHAEAVLAEAEMRRVIELNQSLDHRFIEGAGQLVARLPLSVALHWIGRYGHDFWQQRDSLDFFAKRNPGMLIKTPGRPTMIVDRKIGGGGPTPAAATDSPEPAADAAAGGIGVNSPAAGVVPAAGAARPATRGGRWAKAT